MAVDWASQQAEWFKARRATQQQESEKSLSDRNFKERSWPATWGELRDAVVKKVNAFNVQMGEEILLFSVDSDKGFSIGRKDNHTSMTFRAASPGPFDITCSIGMGQVLQYSLEIKSGDEVGFKSKSGGFTESEFIAENAIVLLLRG